MLVKKSQEKTFAKPAAPTEKEPSAGKLAEFKSELSLHQKECKEHEEHKAKVFVVILGQCSVTVKSKLENDSSCDQLEADDDVVGLLAKLKELAFSTSGVQHPHWTMQLVMRQLSTVHQGQRESVARHHK